jgi:hypothetical protein
MIVFMNVLSSLKSFNAGKSESSGYIINEYQGEETKNLGQSIRKDSEYNTTKVLRIARVTLTRSVGQ